MQFTIIALGVALAVLVVSMCWIRCRNQKDPQARCRRDIQALRRTSQPRSKVSGSDDIWSAGADPDPAQSRAKKTVAWVAVGAVGGCGGCGGCGCGG